MVSKVIALPQSSLDFYHRQAYDYGLEGEIEKQRRCYEAALELAPNDAFTNFQLGNILFELGEFAKAITAFHRVLHSLPNHVLTLRRIGSTLLKLNEYSEAEEVFHRILALRPSDIRALAGLHAIDDYLRFAA